MAANPIGTILASHYSGDDSMHWVVKLVLFAVLMTGGVNYTAPTSFPLMRSCTS